MTPDFKELPAFTLVGYLREFTPATMPEIAAFWEECDTKLRALPNTVPGVSYGLVQSHRDDLLRYHVGMEYSGDAELPRDVESLHVPACRYAVFTFDDHISGIGEFIRSVWEKHLPANGLTMAEGGYDFERYDSRWKPESGTGPVEYYVAIELL